MSTPIDVNSAAFLAHMNTLQGIITRLAGASASCKTWCLGLVTAILGLTGSTHTPDLLRVALVPVLIFAFMDINYLSQERWFRHLYSNMAKRVSDGGCTGGCLFQFEKNKRWLCDFFCAMFSFSIGPIYLGLAVACGLGPCYLAHVLKT